VRVLLAGAEGQLGRVLRSGFGSHEVIAPSEAELDICDRRRVEEALDRARPDLLLNAAAYTDVDGAESDPEAAFAGNARGPGILAVASERRGIPILHLSTDYVFDGEAGRPYDERDETGPCSVYGRSKLEGEEAVRHANPRHFVVRTSWLYAAEGRNFPLTMLELAEGPEVRVVSDQFGSPTFAPHLRAGLLELLEAGSWGTYHLAGRGVASWYEFASALYGELGIGTPVRPVATSEFPRPAKRPRFSALDTVQEPRILLPPWREGLTAFAAAVVRHRDEGRRGS
jgi:dTDP-4-dehydrorhamnose reductase